MTSRGHRLCYVIDKNDRVGIVFKVREADGDRVAGTIGYGLKFTYNPLNSNDFKQPDDPDGRDVKTPSLSLGGHHGAMIPGSEFYYLSRLGRLELLGIPQIVHEPLRCNSNKENNCLECFNE